MLTRPTPVALAVILALASAPLAAGVPIAPRLNLEWSDFSASAELASPQGLGGRLSDFNTDVSGLLRLNLGATLQPTGWLRLDLDYAFLINDADTDLDYLRFGYADSAGFYPALQASAQDASVETANRFDVLAQFPLWRFDQALVTGGLGYLNDDFAFEANRYRARLSPPSGAQLPALEQDLTGAMSYDATYSGIYLALGTIIDLQRWVLSAQLRYSPQMKVDASYDFFLASDPEGSRAIDFEPDLDDSDYLLVRIAAAYRITNQISVTAAYTYTDYGDAGADVTRVDQSAVAFPANVSASSNAFSLGISYQF